jgi:hypothetical protein
VSPLQGSDIFVDIRGPRALPWAKFCGPFRADPQNSATSSSTSADTGRCPGLRNGPGRTSRKVGPRSARERSFAERRATFILGRPKRNGPGRTSRQRQLSLRESPDFRGAKGDKSFRPRPEFCGPFRANSQNSPASKLALRAGMRAAVPAFEPFPWSTLPFK